ncbi:hypothetical protein [Nguyenibacter vanlangensis]|uniref:Uncharacterized protein n=1 Tax=Nguyenibacter vanlangensis TaxID=1216886 RepID=A0A7Y7IUL4_9PROT|nr:hypothetical protein [Nguyenibacter vanlangensis]NVN10363.1 hypothetical protein [Nguyenibacter vanlangensis]
MPERAAASTALGIRLSGPPTYAGRVADEPWLNGAAPDQQPADLVRGLTLYRRAMVMLAALMVLIILLNGHA